MNKNVESSVGIFNTLIKNKGSEKEYIEFEIKIQYVTYDIFKEFFNNLLKEYKNTAEISQTINFINTQNEGTSNIRTLYFVDGVQKETKYFEKSRKYNINYIDFNKNFIYKLTISKENEISDVLIDSFAMVRIKKRTTFVIENWKIDLTIVKSFSIVPTDLKVYKERIFPTNFKNDVTNFLKLDNIEDYNYEIEIEYNSQSIALSFNEVNNILLIVNNNLSSKFKEEILLQGRIYEISQYLYEYQAKKIEKFKYNWGLKNLLPQVTALTKINYIKIYPPVNYFLLDKTDGLRSIAFVKYDNVNQKDSTTVTLFVLTYKDIKIFNTNNTTINKNTIVDCELYVDKNENVILYLFDVILYEDQKLYLLNYEKRIQRLKDSEKIINEFKGIKAITKNIIKLEKKDKSYLEEQFYIF